MQKRQTHFEQIPLKAIKRIIEEATLIKSDPAPAPKLDVETSDELLLAAAGDRKGGRQ